LRGLAEAGWKRHFLMDQIFFWREALK